MKVCKKCGTEIKKGVEYCPKCGNLIEWNEPSEINKYLDKNRNTLKWIIYVLGYVYYIWLFRNIESWGELRGISWFIILSAWYLFVNKKIIDKFFYIQEHIIYMIGNSILLLIVTNVVEIPMKMLMYLIVIPFIQVPVWLIVFLSVQAICRLILTKNRAGRKNDEKPM